MSMATFAFNNTTCCGLAIISVLDWGRDPTRHTPWTRYDLIEAYYADISNDGLDTVGAFLATTNQHEELTEQCLVNAGFARMHSFHNPNSFNTVTTWLLELTEEEAKQADELC